MFGEFAAGPVARCHWPQFFGKFLQDLLLDGIGLKFWEIAAGPVAGWPRVLGSFRSTCCKATAATGRGLEKGLEPAANGIIRNYNVQKYPCLF